jgi:exopolyphosphatase/guanosine-5'-triphosphate,3'-diphosphate pyrophosphatase
MLAAAIDAGSNTLRLLIGRVVDGRVVPQLYQRRICRLAGNFSQQEGLSAESRVRTLSVFREFSFLCQKSEVEQVRAIGTAAFRQAVNGENFADQVRETTGLPLEIVNGETEGYYTARGVISALDPVPAQALIFDIGGGSTEFIFYVDGRVVWSRSFSLGVVHLTETCTSPVARQTEISKTLAMVQAELQRACISSGADLAKLTLVGTAGTVTTLAALDMQMSEYDWRRVNNYSMPYHTLQNWYERLCPMTPPEREALPGMEPGRGDLIIAGLEIVLGIIQATHSERLVASDFGILEGLLLSMYDVT